MVVILCREVIWVQVILKARIIVVVDVVIVQAMYQSVLEVERLVLICLVFLCDSQEE